MSKQNLNPGSHRRPTQPLLQTPNFHHSSPEQSSGPMIYPNPPSPTLSPLQPKAYPNSPLGPRPTFSQPTTPPAQLPSLVRSNSTPPLPQNHPLRTSLSNSGSSLPSVVPPWAINAPIPAMNTPMPAMNTSMAPINTPITGMNTSMPAITTPLPANSLNTPLAYPYGSANYYAYQNQFFPSPQYYPYFYQFPPTYPTSFPSNFGHSRGELPLSALSANIPKTFDSASALSSAYTEMWKKSQKEEERKQIELEKAKQQFELANKKRLEELEQELLAKQKEEIEKEVEKKLKVEHRKSLLEKERLEKELAEKIRKEEEQRLEELRLKQEEELKKTQMELLQQKAALVKEKTLLAKKEEEMKRNAELRQKELIEKAVQERIRIEQEKLTNQLEEQRRQTEENLRREYQGKLQERLNEEKKKLEKEENDRKEEFVREWTEKLKTWEVELQATRAQAATERQKRLEVEELLRRQAKMELKQSKSKEEEERKKLNEHRQTILVQIRQRNAEAEATRYKKVRTHTQMLNFHKLQEALKSMENAEEEKTQKKNELEELFSKEEEVLKEEHDRNMKSIARSLQDWEIDLKDLVYGPSLGTGSFGEVFQATYKGRPVAVKKMLVQNVDEEALNDFRTEVEIMANLMANPHPNILLGFGACTKPGNLCIVMELMTRGSLDALLFIKKENMPFCTRMQILKDVINGMSWLHQLKPAFLHRDLKTANLLVDENYRVKIADFGLGSIKSLDEEGNRGAVGSPFYMAPEVMLDKDYDEKADVYSFGITAWEILTNLEPYAEDEFESFKDLTEAVTLEKHRPPIPTWFIPGLKDLVVSCWDNDPKFRPSFSSLATSKTIDNATIDFLLKDPLAAQFWKDNFLEMWNGGIKWDNFISAFTKHFKKNLDSRSIKCMKAILVVDKSDLVTIEKFIHLISFFGPLDLNFSFVTTLTSVVSQGWFFGEKSTVEAEAILKPRKKGTWLIRLNWTDQPYNQISNEERAFTLSVLEKNGSVSHTDIIRNRSTGVLTFKGSTYQSFNDFLQKNKKEFPAKLAACAIDSK